MQVKEPRRPSDDSRRELPPLRILLAEDDADLRALVSGDLRRAGYSVVECADGAALLGRLESEDGIRGSGVDLVVADVRMPELSGIEVLQRLRAAESLMPFIVVTAFGSPEVRQTASRLGAVAVLDKPFEIVDLLRLVEGAVGSAARPAR